MAAEPAPAPLGLLGGTFDPIHHAHLRLALEARDRLRLGGVRLIPAGRPPHRGAPAGDARHRLEMTRLAVAELPGFEVDAAEVLADAPSYTVHTLRRLRVELGPTRPLVLLMGADAFHGLESWFEWRALFALAHIGLATRPGYSLATDTLPAALAEETRRRLRTDPSELANQPAGLILSFEMTALDISATVIRTQLQRGQDPRFLLPDAVLDYIQTHRLYRL